MTKQEMINLLLGQIGKSDSVCGDQVILPKEAAVELVRMLSGQTEIRQIPNDTDGKILFYCIDCSKSFRAVGREDEKCFEKWHYHTWYANCPECGRNISQTDRYWR